jgi:hypothetical protein
MEEKLCTTNVDSPRNMNEAKNPSERKTEVKNKISPVPKNLVIE